MVFTTNVKSIVGFCYYMAVLSMDMINCRRSHMHYGIHTAYVSMFDANINCIGYVGGKRVSVFDYEWNIDWLKFYY